MRKLRFRDEFGKYHIKHMDELVQEPFLEMHCDTILLRVVASFSEHHVQDVSSMLARMT